MTIKVTKPEINVIEKLNELKQDTGLKGQELMRADTVAEARTAIAAGRKNLIINGDMNVAQRATSVTGHTTSGYTTLDRAATWLSVLGTWTLSKDTDSPEGFSSSWKFDCTTADTSIAADSYFTAGQKIEGQDLQHLKYGTSNAQSVTLSFWVKSSKTGTYMCELFQDDGSGKNSITYTINSANTWEKKSMTFAGNTGTAIANDNTTGLRVYWVLAAGSNRTSGTHSNNTWHTTTANRYPGIVNLADSTSNNLYITGAQLEAGSVATDFEHRSYGDNVARCQRYYQHGTTSATYCGFSNGSSQVYFTVPLTTPLRASPTLLRSGSGTRNWTAVKHNGNNNSTADPSVVTYVEGACDIACRQTGHSGLSDMYATNIYASSYYIIFDAEL